VARAEAYIHATFHLDPPTVWSQADRQTDRTDKTDNRPIAQVKPFRKRSPKNDFFLCYAVLSSVQFVTIRIAI